MQLPRLSLAFLRIAGEYVASGAHKRKERSAAIYPNVNSAARCALVMTFTISRARRVT